MTLNNKPNMFWGIVLFFILISSCAHQVSQKIEVNNDQSTPSYRLGYGDVIEVKFFDNDRFNRQATIRPDGRITLEKMGDIYVAGLTPQQVDSMITEKYQGILKSPDVSIFVHQFSNQKVYVLGEVHKPGSYQIEKGMTITHAIAMAGGFNKLANKRSVLLLRKKIDGTLAAERFNLKHLLSLSPDIIDQQVQSLDIVYVPRTFIANIDAFVDQFFNLILPPIDVYWRIWFMDQVNSN